MNGNDEKMGWVKAWKLTKRGFGIIRRLCPPFMPLSAANSLINALQPLFILYMSARILDELQNVRNIKTVATYVILATVITFLLSVLRSIFSRKLKIIESTFYQKLYFFHGERYMELDFEHVEKSKTNEMLADIEAKINGNAIGIPRLYWEFPDLLQNSLGFAVSCLLLLGMFSTTAQYAKNFFTSPYALAMLWAMVALAIVLTLAMGVKEQAELKKVFEANPKANSFFHYYANYVKAGQAGKDIRIYDQKPAILSIVKYGLNMRQWHEFFGFEGRLNGTVAAANALVGGCVYLLIGLRALAGMYSIGNVVQYVGAVTSLVSSLTALMNGFAGFKTNSRYLELFYEYMDLPDNKYKGALTTEKRSDNEYEIEFHKVSFKYPGTDNFALRELSLKIHIGERLAVVGMNGSGKSTMIKLLCRLYDPTEGMITLNGIDIRKYDYDEYMSIFSVVFQDFKLFSLSLGQNVAASSGMDAAKAESSLEKAGFSDRLKEMPGGLDTCLYKDFSKDGVEISGGEAQKIALARALYKDAPFIVLDEPTAALDPIAEFEIYSRFNEFAEGKTAIFISHRLSSCRFCHDIVVFHQGRLVQRGSHDTLLADAKGKYHELWHAQAQYYASEQTEVEATVTK